MRRRLLRHAVFLLLLAAVRVHAAITTGDLLTASEGPPVGFFVFGDLGVLHADGSYNQLRTYQNGGAWAVGVATPNRLYVSEILPLNPRLVVADANGTPITVLSPGIFNDFAFDQAGNGYAATGTVLKYSPAGQLLATYNPAVSGQYPSVRGVDLAADQCTLYYTAGSSTIKRFDLCRNTQLTDFATIPGEQLRPIRILPSGDLLVGGLNGLYRIDATGTIRLTFQPFGTDPVFSYKAIAVADSTSVWIAWGSSIERIDYQSGTIVQGPLFGPATEIQSLAVVGELRAGTSPAPIPALTPLAIIALAAALAGIALLRQ